MLNRKLGLVIAAAMTALCLMPLDVLAAPEKAICLVCKVMHGEAEEEPVKAVRFHEGKEYGFCSEKCAKAFMADPAAFLPPALPREAPSFSVADLDGRPISNKSLEGRVVLLDFWATWCAPCRKSMPELQALHDKYSARGFGVVGMSIDEGGPSKVKKFVQSKQIRYPIAMDSGKAPAWDAFKVKAVPAAFLIDREGRIVAQWTGSPPSGKELEEKLEELLRAD
jgi:peroxiredoxin/YHS domain-containing protein